MRNARRAADQEGWQACGAAQGADGRVAYLRQVEAKAGAAEAKLLAMLELEEGAAAGSAKGKAKGNKTKRG